MKKILIILIAVFILTSCDRNSYSHYGSYIIRNGSIELENQTILGEYDYFDGEYTIIFTLNGSYEFNFKSNDNQVKACIKTENGEIIANLDEMNKNVSIEQFKGKVNVEFEANKSENGFILEIEEREVK